MTKEIKSKKYSFNKKDIKDVSVMALVTGLGAIALFFAETVLPNLDFGKYNEIIIPLIPVITYGIRKYVQG